MLEATTIFIGAALVNNLVLSGFLGLCPLFGSSNRSDTTVGVALATLVVLMLSSGASWLLHRHLLVPFEIEYLSTLAFILVIAGLVQATEITLRKTSPLLHRVLGLYLPLITTNCIVLGVALISIRAAASFAHAVALGAGAAVGFGLVLIVFASLRERLRNSAVPAPLQGAGIAMLTAGIMSMAFMGFSGVAENVLYAKS